MTTFWREHQVGGPYETINESLRALGKRRTLYPDLERLMPTVQPGLRVLDYGCGPGHDTVQFVENGAAITYYTDTSGLAIRYTDQRLHAHGFEDLAQYVTPRRLPEVDHVHCAGVLHHTDEANKILWQFRYTLDGAGEARIMVYDGSLSEHTQSKVPITHWWTHDEFICMAENAEFKCEYVGSYECSAPWRPNCFAACYLLT